MTTLTLPDWPEDIGRCDFGTLEQPRLFRDFYEHLIVQLLAGKVGSLMAGPIVAHMRDTDDDFDERAALALARRSDRVHTLFTEEHRPILADEAKALMLSAALHSGDMTPNLTTHAHLAWLRCEARDLLERHAAELEALAVALNERIELTGEEVAEIIASARAAAAPSGQEGH